MQCLNFVNALRSYLLHLSSPGCSPKNVEQFLWNGNMPGVYKWFGTGVVELTALVAIIAAWKSSTEHSAERKSSSRDGKMLLKISRYKISRSLWQSEYIT